MQTLVERLYENKPLMLAAAVIAFLIAALLLLVIIRMLFGGRLRMPGGRTRQARLGIVDAFDLDRQRQLIIIRRDNTEHLIMIGGPNDVLIESEIIRVEAREQRDGRRDKPDGLALPPNPSFEPRIPAPFTPAERVETVVPPSERGFRPNLDDPAMPLPLPPAIPALVPETVAVETVPQQREAPPAQRAPTFPLPPRRPVQPVPERRPVPSPRPPERPVRTEPAAPSLDMPPPPPPVDEPVQAAAIVPPPLPPVAPTPPAVAPAPPVARPAPPPFLRPLPPRPPKVLQRTTPVAAAPVPTEPAAAPTPAPAPVAPAPVKDVAPPPAQEPVAPKDTLESLEEEMAKLLGRGSGEG